MPNVFVEMLSGFQRLRRDEFDLDDRHHSELVETARWCSEVLEIAHRQEHGRER